MHNLQGAAGGGAIGVHVAGTEEQHVRAAALEQQWRELLRVVVQPPHPRQVLPRVLQPLRTQLLQLLQRRLQPAGLHGRRPPRLHAQPGTAGHHDRPARQEPRRPARPVRRSPPARTHRPAEAPRVPRPLHPPGPLLGSRVLLPPATWCPPLALQAPPKSGRNRCSGLEGENRRRDEAKHVHGQGLRAVEVEQRT